jgi:hypothetical protein
MYLIQSCRFHLLLFILLILSALVLTGCGSTVTEQVSGDEPVDDCPDAIIEFGNIEVSIGEKDINFSFDVPAICCHHVVVQLYYQGEYLDHWESPYEFGGGHRETVIFTAEGSYPSGSYEVRIGTGILVHLNEVFLIS